MEIVIGIIVALFAVVGIVVLVKSHKTNKKNEPEKEPSAPASDCCGAHEICEFDKAKVDQDFVEYYDDEELDAFQNINESEYSSDQVEQFRDVLYTLKPDEIKFWLLSIERRNIQLPTILQSEARFLMAEA